MIKIKLQNPIKITFDKYLIKRKFLFLKQKLTRGFSDDATWCLSLEMAKFMIPRLTLFKELTVGYPPDLSPEQWYEILDELIWYFERIELYSNDAFTPSSDEENERFDNAGELFKEYVMNLWW